MRRSRLETRARILDAAYGLFWRQGFLRVGMDDIAARAGVTKRTLYQHFSSKDDLIKSALASSSEFALSRLRQFKRPSDIDDFIESVNKLRPKVFFHFLEKSLRLIVFRPLRHLCANPNRCFTVGENVRANV